MTIKWYSTLPKLPRLDGASSLDCLMSDTGHSFREVGGSYPSVEMKSEYSTAPADWAMQLLGFPQNSNHHGKDKGESRNPKDYLLQTV